MFKVFINDGKENIPTDDICYIIGKKGIYLKKKLGIMESIALVDNISILEDVKTTAKLHIPKIPGKLFAQIYKFTKEVYETYQSESVTLLYYNTSNRKFKVLIPAQKVSGASIEYTKDETPKNYTLIGTIHSHAGFSAFHSSIDDKDEKNFDGIHITIGKLGSDDFELSCSIVSNGSRFISLPETYINGINKVITNENVLSKDYSLHESLLNENFNPEWMDKVEKKTYTIYNRSGGFVYDFLNDRSLGLNSNRSNYFNPSIRSFSQQRRNLFNFNEELDDDDFNPCEDCPFKNYKLEMMIEDLEEDENEILEAQEESFLNEGQYGY